MTRRDGTTSPGTKDVVVEQDEKGDLVESSDVGRHQERPESFVAAHFKSCRTAQRILRHVAAKISLTLETHHPRRLGWRRRSQ